MLLRLPHSLHYPISITSILKSRDDAVSRNEPLFTYTYQTTVTEGNEFGEKRDVKRTFPSRFESSIDGTIAKWLVRQGQVIRGPIEVVEVEEPCAHEVQFGGMCADCGKDMNEIGYNTEVLDASRAPIRMVHDNSHLLVSRNEASRIEDEAKKRLLASKKLSLVVDLDLTIIHATVDPTVGEWQEDVNNPNHEAVKEVRKFQLMDDAPGQKGNWYYVKLRPGLQEFLEHVSALFELHIYTMGTRSYALHIAKIVDPDGKYFGDRILSRDESGSLTAKNLQRIFPVDTKMVLIIDDRGDVWKWSDNLIKVDPYNFFVGIGDINSTFLPKKQEFGDALAVTKTEDNKAEATEAASTEQTSETKNVSTLEQLVSMSGGGDLEAQVHQQDEALAREVESRPLLQKQRELDAEEDAAEAEEHNTTTNGDNNPSATEDSARHHRHNLLRDDDTELIRLEERLSRVHRTFFKEFERRKVEKAKSSRTSNHEPNSDTDIDLSLVPDVKAILPPMKTPILSGVTLVFSGILPLGTDIQSADITLWTRTFGAVVKEKITKGTTHVVAGRNRTAKVRQAARHKGIKIVSFQWLVECLTRWERVAEDAYEIEIHPEDRKGFSIEDAEGDFEGTSLSFLLSDSESAEDDSEDEDGDNDDGDVEIEDPALSPDIDLTKPLGIKAIDQAAVDKELEEFLAGESSDSEDDENRYADSDDDDDDDNQEEDEEENGSRTSTPSNTKSQQSKIEESPSQTPTPTSSPSKKRKRPDLEDEDEERQEETDTPTETPDGENPQVQSVGNTRSSIDVPGSRLSQRIKLSHERGSSGLKEEVMSFDGDGVGDVDAEERESGTEKGTEAEGEAEEEDEEDEFEKEFMNAFEGGDGDEEE